MLQGTLFKEKTKKKEEHLSPFSFDETERMSIFMVYFEFVVSWTRGDADSYRNAMAVVPGSREKKLFYEMIIVKQKMIGILNNYSMEKSKKWFEPLQRNTAQTSAHVFMIDSDFKPIVSLNDAFHFAYRKEYQSLSVFEKVGRSKLDAAIHTVLDCAIDIQRKHIMYLDASLSCVKKCEELNYSREAFREQTNKIY